MHWGFLCHNCSVSRKMFPQTFTLSLTGHDRHILATPPLDWTFSNPSACLCAGSVALHWHAARAPSKLCASVPIPAVWVRPPLVPWETVTNSGKTRRWEERHAADSYCMCVLLYACKHNDWFREYILILIYFCKVEGDKSSAMYQRIPVNTMQWKKSTSKQLTKLKEKKTSQTFKKLNIIK